MFNATYFTYDGVYSGAYNLKIASFDSETVEDTAVFAPTLNITKSARARRFLHNGIEYDDAPEYTFSIISQEAISDAQRREILTWLVGRNDFKKLQMHQPEFEDYYYNCVFTSADLIYVRGRCHGFTVTAKFDSIFAYGRPKKITVTGTGTTQTVKIVNNSDIPDDYIYPIVTFTMTEEGNVTILNTSEAVQAEFKFTGARNTETITVDNELKIIESTIGGDRLSLFNKNWLRLQHGVNVLQITLKGTMTITVPTYAMIGF